MDEIEALAVLVNIAPLQPEKLRLLIEAFGSAEAALRTPQSQLAQLPGFGEKLCGQVSRWEQDFSWRNDLELVARCGVDLIPYWDSRYPKQLRDLSDHPLLLYVRGALTESDCNAFAIVGTRHPTIYGGEITTHLSKELAALGFTVVSGLRRGVDAIAHRAALKTGRTIAVIGSGLNVLYPPENEGLADEIAKYGAVISELPMATPLERHIYARRSRLISGLSHGLILTEAPLKSGAMATMKLGWEQRRKLFALPGRVDAASFRGNHWLIKQRRAQLIETGRDAAEACKTLLNFSERKEVDQLAVSEPRKLLELPGQQR